MTQNKSSEETKIIVKKSDVSISPDGEVTIKDAKMIEKLKAHHLKDARSLQAEGVSVGVVVSKEF
jgi:hypothetical protein